MNYSPKPIDTSDIALPENLEHLVEQLAENVHDQWAAGRMAEGWTYGPRRDDGKKHHPCLVAYGDLPESEKEYDRVTALETVKTMIKLGYRVEKA